MLKMIDEIKRHEEYRRKAALWDCLSKDIEVNRDSYKGKYLRDYDQEDLYFYRAFCKIRNIMVSLEGLKDWKVLEK